MHSTPFKRLDQRLTTILVLLVIKISWTSDVPLDQSYATSIRTPEVGSRDVFHQVVIPKTKLSSISTAAAQLSAANIS
jgi:hypothetical protein